MDDLKQSQGRLTFLRAHDVGTGWGPPNDQLDVEVVFMLDSVSQAAYGFQLRTDDNQPVRQAMFMLLRDAYLHSLTVQTDFYVDPGKHNGSAFRVALIR